MMGGSEVWCRLGERGVTWAQGPIALLGSDYNIHLMKRSKDGCMGGWKTVLCILLIVLIIPFSGCFDDESDNSISLEKLIDTLENDVTMNITFDRDNATYGYNDTVYLSISKVMNFDEEELRDQLPNGDEIIKYYYSFSITPEYPSLTWKINIENDIAETVDPGFQIENGNKEKKYYCILSDRYSDVGIKLIKSYTITLSIKITREYRNNDGAEPDEYFVNEISRTLTVVDTPHL